MSYQWLTKDYWTIEEATMALLDKGPEEVASLKPRSRNLLSNQTRDLWDSITRAVSAGSIETIDPISQAALALGYANSARVKPISVLAWAYDKGFDLPDYLEQYLLNASSKGDDGKQETSRINKWVLSERWTPAEAVAALFNSAGFDSIPYHDKENAHLLRQAIIVAANSGTIKADQAPYDPLEHGNRDYQDNNMLLYPASLLAWAIGKGLPIPDRLNVLLEHKQENLAKVYGSFMDPGHEHYSHELCVAAKCWLELFGRGKINTKGKSVKSAIKVWLKQNGGQLTAGAIDRIAVVVNPDKTKTGGAPTTD